MSATTEPTPSLRGELLIVALALVSVALLVLEAVTQLQPHQQKLLERVDVVIALLFLGEWLWRLKKADNRTRFFARSWWELLAAIPLTNDVTRTLRGVRLLRVIRIVRILRIIRLGVRLTVIASRMKVFGQATHLISISMTVATIVLTGAVGFHYFEFGVNPNVDSFFDSVWWSVVTVTTVGYGDIFPVTTEGRIIAMGLLIVGLASFGTFTAAIAAWMARKDQQGGE